MEGVLPRSWGTGHVLVDTDRPSCCFMGGHSKKHYPQRMGIQYNFHGIDIGDEENEESDGSGLFTLDESLLTGSSSSDWDFGDE